MSNTRFKLMIIAIFVCAFVFGCVYAAEAAPVVEEGAKTSWWTGLIPHVIEGLGAGVLALINLLFGWILVKVRENSILTQALNAVRVGVDKANDEFVIWAKRAAADGKLDKDERAKAVEIAKQHALEIAKGPAKDLILSWGAEELKSWIKRIIEQKKAASESATK